MACFSSQNNVLMDNESQKLIFHNNRKMFTNVNFKSGLLSSSVSIPFSLFTFLVCRIILFTAILSLGLWSVHEVGNRWCKLFFHHLGAWCPIRQGTGRHNRCLYIQQSAGTALCVHPQEMQNASKRERKRQDKDLTPQKSTQLSTCAGSTGGAISTNGADQ